MQSTTPEILPQPGMRIDLSRRSRRERDMAIPAASIHSEPVQRGEGLTPDGDVPTRHMYVVFHHCQGLMSQVLLEEENVSSVKQEPRSVSVP